MRLLFATKFQLQMTQQLQINVVAHDKLQMTTSRKQWMKYFFIEYECGDFIHL